MNRPDPILIAPPSAPILSPTECDDHIKPDSEDDAAYILALANVVSNHIDGPETISGRCFREQTWREVFSAFPPSGTCLAVSPVKSIASITYFDPEGIEQTLPSGQAEIVTSGRVPRVYFTGELPATAHGRSVVRIDTVCGFDPDSPEYTSAKHAARLLLGHFYANREEIIVAAGLSVHRLPYGVRALLAPIRKAYA